MEDWTYKELKESIYEDIDSFKNEDYLNSQIAGRCFYEYTTVISDGYTESIIVYTTIAKYIINECSYETIKFHCSNILEVLECYDQSKLHGSLTEEEIKELESDIEYVCNKLK